MIDHVSSWNLSLDGARFKYLKYQFENYKMFRQKWNKKHSKSTQILSQEDIIFLGRSSISKTAQWQMIIIWWSHTEHLRIRFDQLWTSWWWYFKSHADKCEVGYCLNLGKCVLDPFKRFACISTAHQILL